MSTPDSGMRTLPWPAVPLVVAILLGAALCSPVGANDCRSGVGAKAPAGTLAAPAAPCAPAARQPAPQPRDAAKKPGTFQSGNTTIHVGGSVRTDVGGGR